MYSPFDSRNIIGYISEVTSVGVKVHFPDSKLLKRFNHHWDSLHGWIVGSFVAVEGETRWFIGKIVRLSLPEKERMNLSESNYKNKEMHPTWLIELLFSFDLLSYKPNRSIQDYPPIASKVYICSSGLYIDILKNGHIEKLDDELDIAETIGTPESVKIWANDIFNRHAAIIGTTWWGKSFTVAKLIEEMVEKKDAKIILLDATWEFSTFDTKSYTESAIFNNGTDSIYFSYKNLVFDDIQALFRPAWQVQLPKLDDAIKSLRIVNILWSDSAILWDEIIWPVTHHAPECSLWILKKEWKSQRLLNKYLYINSEKIHENLMDIDIMKLTLQLNQQEFFYVNNEVFWSWRSDTNQREKDNCSSLVLRIGNIITSKYGNAIFNFKNDIPEDYNIIKKINEFYLSDTKKLLRIDLSSIPETWSIKEILVNALGRFLLNKSKNREFIDKPLIVILDEAHLFLNNKVRDEYSLEVQLDSFDRIAKECRKFWLFLCLSTQRPRDIPEWVLSQIWTFIVHRLINDKDKQAIENASSSYSKEFLSFLPWLWEGEAIIMWVNFLTTLFVKIKKPTIEPNSKTPKLFRK